MFGFWRHRSLATTVFLARASVSADQYWDDGKRKIGNYIRRREQALRQHPIRSRKVEPAGSAIVGLVQQIIEKFLDNLVEVCTALVNTIGIGQREHGKARWRAFTPDHGFQRVFGCEVSVSGQQVIPLLL